MIQLRRQGPVADKEDVERLRCQFEKKHWVILPGLLDSQLLALALSYIEQGRWRKKEVEGFYSESILEIGPAGNLLLFVCNTPAFLRVIGEITRFDCMTWFQGRVYRMKAGHTDDWHDDTSDGRLIAMSINLSPRGYQGGIFQMRESKSHRILMEIANTGLGDALLFRLSTDLQHQVTEVQAGEPRTAFAGWFHSTKESMRERLNGQKVIQTAST
jgi:hypothetical protein